MKTCLLCLVIMVFSVAAAQLTGVNTELESFFTEMDAAIFNCSDDERAAAYAAAWPEDRFTVVCSRSYDDFHIARLKFDLTMVDLGAQTTVWERESLISGTVMYRTIWTINGEIVYSAHFADVPELGGILFAIYE